MELIKINVCEDGRRTVSARELHCFLGVTERFSQWFVKRVEKYDFIEGEDFTGVKTFTLVNNGGKIELDDYALTIDMAKELCMIQNSNRGKEARRYFISCEKKLKEVIAKQSLLLDIYEGGEKGIIASKKLVELEVREKTLPLLQKIEEDKPLVDFTNTVLKSSDNILVRELAKIASDEGINIGEKRLYAKLREWKMIFKGSTEPYQAYINNKYFVVEEKPISTPFGEKLVKTTKITPLGQLKIIAKLKKELSMAS